MRNWPRSSTLVPSTATLIAGPRKVLPMRTSPGQARFRGSFSALTAEFRDSLLPELLKTGQKDSGKQHGVGHLPSGRCNLTLIRLVVFPRGNRIIRIGILGGGINYWN